MTEGSCGAHIDLGRHVVYTGRTSFSVDAAARSALPEPSHSAAYPASPSSLPHPLLYPIYFSALFPSIYTFSSRFHQQ